MSNIYTTYVMPLLRRFPRSLSKFLPKGLYARFLLIVIVPMILLQAMVAYFFIERHWQSVTVRLSHSVVQHIAALVDLSQANKQAVDWTYLTQLAQDRFGLQIAMHPLETVARPFPNSDTSRVGRVLTRELKQQMGGRPFWVDSVTRPDIIDVHILLDYGVLQVRFHRDATSAKNLLVFLVSMILTSGLLLAVAIAFSRNQIRPIIRLARAAEAFGKGRESHFRPHGAREVREAGYAFIEMKRRIERTIDQRTTMLNGVSHDIRTILTRFTLSLALLGNSPEVQELEKDVQEMQRMLEAYLAFARGDGGEKASEVDLTELLTELRTEMTRQGTQVTLRQGGDPIVMLRRDAFKRCLTNLLFNARRYGGNIWLTSLRDKKWLTIHVDDDGPGIMPENREEVFRPFFRLDEARNQDEGGAGLGLSIARDIARAHGGDITLGTSPMQGLRATIRLPV